MFNDKSILITGGTGSLGKALTKRIFRENPLVKRLVIFSRDEQKTVCHGSRISSGRIPSN